MSEPAGSRPPSRPSTSWVTAPPLTRARQQRAARSSVVSFWLWVGAALAATATGALALTEYDRMHAVLYEIAQQQDAAADTVTLGSVATLAIAVLVGGGIAFTLIQLIFAAAMRNGRSWARGVLVVLAFLGVVYALVLIETITSESLGDLVLPVRIGLFGYIGLVVSASVAMFSRRPSTAASG